VICEGIGVTKDQAYHYHSQDVKYKKRWIRGEAKEPVYIHYSEPDHDHEKFTVRSVMEFTNRKFL